MFQELSNSRTVVTDITVGSNVFLQFHTSVDLATVGLNNK